MQKPHGTECLCAGVRSSGKHRRKHHGIGTESIGCAELGKVMCRCYCEKTLSLWMKPTRGGVVAVRTPMQRGLGIAGKDHQMTLPMRNASELVET